MKELKPRVIVLAPNINGFGGIERVSRSCIKSLVEKYGPERVGLLTLGTAPEGLSCKVLTTGNPAGRLGTMAKLRFSWNALRIARRSRENLVLIAIHPHLAPIAALAAWISNAPFGVWCFGKESWGPIRSSVKAALRRAFTVVAPSDFTARNLERVAHLTQGSLRVLHLGVGYELPTEVLLGAKVFHKQVVVSVARLDIQDSYKGIDTLLHVWARVTRRVPEAQLWVVGDGPDSKRLKTIAEALMIEGSIRFFGAVTDKKLGEIYRSAAVFALPSRTSLGPIPEGEGFGLVYIEAGAAGLPVIGAKGGGADEAVIHGLTGYLIDADDPIELEDAIVNLLTDVDSASRMGEEGRRRAISEFSYEAFAARICNVVDELFSTRTKAESLS